MGRGNADKQRLSAWSKGNLWQPMGQLYATEGAFVRSKVITKRQVFLCGVNIGNYMNLNKGVNIGNYM